MQMLKSSMVKHGIHININELDEEEYANNEFSELAIWREQKEFFRHFAQKLEIYDPIDREILGQSDQNQAINRA